MAQLLERDARDEGRRVRRWKGPGWTIIEGEAREGLERIETESVQCIVTSPPYFWLRDYGDKRQIGHEATPGLYAEAVRATLSAARRTLRRDGTCFINIADTYYSGKGRSQGRDGKNKRRRMGLRAVDRAGGMGVGLRRKTLIGIPWRTVQALTEDGWIWRALIMWRKGNAQPETARDRPSRTMEPVLVMTREPRYRWNARAEGAGEDLWEIETRSRSRAESCAAVFPEDLATRCIAIGSGVGDVVLDPFMGEGTTLRAACALGRRTIGIDLDGECCRKAHRTLQSRNGHQFESDSHGRSEDQRS